MAILQSAQDDGGLEDTQRSSSTLLSTPSFDDLLQPCTNTVGRTSIELHYVQLMLSNLAQSLFD